jgi:hypothetical protein
LTAGDRAAREAGGWLGLSLYTAPNLSSRKRQSIARASFANAWFMSMI